MTQLGLKYELKYCKSNIVSKIYVLTTYGPQNQDYAKNIKALGFVST